MPTIVFKRIFLSLLSFACFSLIFFNRTRANSFSSDEYSTTFSLFFFFKYLIGPSIIKLLSLTLFLSTAAITLLTVYSLLVNAPNSTNEPALSQIIDIICELLAKNCS